MFAKKKNEKQVINNWLAGEWLPGVAERQPYPPGQANKQPVTVLGVWHDVKGVHLPCISCHTNNVKDTSV